MEVLRKLENENKELKTKCWQLESMVLASQKQSNDDLISLLCQFREAKQEIDLLTSENIAKEAALVQTQAQLKHARGTIEFDVSDFVNSSDQGSTDHQTISQLEKQVETLKNEAMIIKEEFEAKHQEALSDLKRVTRKNDTMLLQVRFMESQIEMLQKEVMAAKAQVGSPHRPQDVNPASILTETNLAQTEGTTPCKVVSLQSSVQKLNEELAAEKAQHAITKVLVQKYKQSQASLLGMVDCYAGCVEQYLQQSHASLSRSHVTPNGSELYDSFVSFLAFAIISHVIACSSHSPRAFFLSIFSSFFLFFFS